MRTPNGPLWTIDELGTRVAIALSVNYDGPPNARVRDVPDLRTIRYYTTLGLLDRPAEMRGRTALYGKRHLLQIVAIKRLQARGLALGAIQRQLVGLTNSGLRRLARLPDLEALCPSTTSSKTRNEAAPKQRAANFWTESPASLPTEKEQREATTPQADAAVIVGTPADTPRGGAAPARAPWQGLPLAENVILLLEPTRTIAPEEIPAIRAAAAPLLGFLESRRLLRSRNERGTT